MAASSDAALMFDCISLVSHRDLLTHSLSSLPVSNKRIFALIRPFTALATLLAGVPNIGSKAGRISFTALNMTDKTRMGHVLCDENTIGNGADTEFGRQFHSIYYSRFDSGVAASARKRIDEESF